MIASPILIREHLWSGQPFHAVEHTQQAVTVLQQSGERHYLGMAHWGMGTDYFLLGESESALEAAAPA